MEQRPREGGTAAPGVHRAYVGPEGREIRRGVTGRFDKRHGRHFVQLHIEDDKAKQQPRLLFRDWR